MHRRAVVLNGFVRTAGCYSDEYLDRAFDDLMKADSLLSSSPSSILVSISVSCVISPINSFCLNFYLHWHTQIEDLKSCAGLNEYEVATGVVNTLA